jgi:hypothetical protein
VARKLTARSVQTIRPVADRQEIADGLLPGLYLIVQPSGAKSWAVRYRHAGTTRKHTLGSYPAITLEAARDLARAALRAVAEGRDPAQEKRERVAPGTVAALVEEFITKHVKRHNKARTAEETERLLNLHVLPRWKRLKVDTISRRDVIDFSRTLSRPERRRPRTTPWPPSARCSIGRSSATCSQRHHAPGLRRRRNRMSANGFCRTMSCAPSGSPPTSSTERSGPWSSY